MRFFFVGWILESLFLNFVGRRAFLRCSLAFNLSCFSTLVVRNNERKLRSSSTESLLIFPQIRSKIRTTPWRYFVAGSYRTPPKFAIRKLPDKLQQFNCWQRLETGARAALKLQRSPIRVRNADLEQHGVTNGRRHGHENHYTVNFRADHRQGSAVSAHLPFQTSPRVTCPCPPLKHSATQETAPRPHPISW